ncbi:LAMI_0F04676g1_1 [Lachancea mirantina]|uniref:LAMI_0F04676g1_1 n=1 Tax=Lachancea mirantina TaxID=1230905 RepID=A0A1G4JY59_9SACH|nr:LAMI_0F04676g1_1 [Lachancea mirantina]
MAHQGVLHEYTRSKVAFEFASLGHEKVVVFIGGLTDGLLTVPYIPVLAERLGQIGWSFVQIQFTSSFKGFGVSSLNQDITDIRALVEYLRSERGGARSKIVIFGHSTGSQDVMHYLLNCGDTVDAGIMQAPVSDREAFGSFMDPQVADRLNARAKSLVLKGQGFEILPREYAQYMMETPISAYRWCSLMLPEGDDDYFSSDLKADRLSSTFGKIKKPFLVAYGEKDEFAPEFVDKSRLIESWREHSDTKFWSQNSGIVKGASHRVDLDASREHLLEMVTAFLKEFEL